MGVFYKHSRYNLSFPVLPFIVDYNPDNMNVTVPEATVVYLECIAIGTPQPTVLWTRDGIQLTEETPNTHVLSERTTPQITEYFVEYSQLTLTSIKPGDSGNYTCTFSNGLEESAEQHFQLFIEGN